MTKEPGDIIVPPLGESVTEATIARWLKQQGDFIKQDEPLVELETDKVTLEVNAPLSGILFQIEAGAGVVVKIGDKIGGMQAAAQGANVASQLEKPQPLLSSDQNKGRPVGEASKVEGSGPAAKKIAAEKGMDLSTIPASGKDGRVTKGDVVQYKDTSLHAALGSSPSKGEERVKMTRLRQRIAERLKEAQHTAAMLTTFNEIDMSHVMNLRNEYKDVFEKRHGIKLGFMSFFVKAVTTALKEIPAVNAEIDGDEIVYKNYYDIGVAVSAPQGLVVPVVRGANSMNFSDIEKEIVNLGQKARLGKLSLDDLTGATFTITNGGVFGSLLSTPILNPPQSGILGMHKIEKRAVVIQDKIEIRPMMYVALTYDHRIIDGREAVTFLVRVKECIENPERILLNV